MREYQSKIDRVKVQLANIFPEVLTDMIMEYNQDEDLTDFESLPLDEL